MRAIHSKFSALAIGSFLAMGFAGCGASNDGINDQMTGHWAAGCVASGNSQYAKRDVVNTASTYQDTIQVYSDAACASLFFTLRVAGPYNVDGPSATVAGAYDVSFVFEHVYLTPATAQAAGFFSSASCGNGNWTPGTEQDVFATGCQPLGFPVFATSCKQEYDLAKVDGDSYMNGTRPSNGSFLCTAASRPTTLGDAVTKQN